MIIDGHHHIVDEYEPILRRMDELGISKTVLVGVGVRDLSVVTIRNSPLFRSDFVFRTWGMIKARQILRSADFRRALLGDPRNDAVLRAVHERPDRFFGFSFVNPESPRALDEARSCLEAGMCGIKLALFQYPTDLAGANMSKLCELAREYRVPIFVHIGLQPGSFNIEVPAERFPDVNFILAHGGVQRYRDLPDLLRSYPNLYVDTSSYVVTTGKLRSLRAKVGAYRLIYGTDVPVMAKDQSEGLKKIEEARLTSRERDQILGENLLNLLHEAVPLGRPKPGPPVD
jgi:predicted TIM-barrel fold metal-dependent hydrolase